eukprot:GHVT01083520.1.p1 GENE.GHVT01083520.1~~GHVT01083520.1.p1  ORF type:complete len:101 (-),score=1.45 GHVT01083520.1:490-792(-)
MPTSVQVNLLCSGFFAWQAKCHLPSAASSTSFPVPEFCLLGTSPLYSLEFGLFIPRPTGVPSSDFQIPWLSAPHCSLIVCVCHFIGFGVCFYSIVRWFSL